MRTLRAAVVADLLGFVLVGGFGWFLGFPLVPSLIAGAVAGSLFLALVLLVAKRSGTLEDEVPPRGGGT